MKIRILNVIPSINPKLGGTVEAAKDITNELLHLGHDSEMLTLDDQDSNWGSECAFKIHNIGPSILKYSFSTKLISWLRTNANKYDVIIVHGIWQFHSFAVWIAFRKLSIPYFVYVHGMLNPWFKNYYPIKHIKKWFYWLLVEYRVFRDAKYVIYTTEEEKIQARKSFSRYVCNEITLNIGISNPSYTISSENNSLTERYPILANKKIILFLSRIHEVKGCDLLVDAFARISEIDDSLHLLIAGPDQVGLVSILKMQAKKLNVTNKITWTGLLQGNEKWDAYNLADVFILPSHTENFGIVVVEALACGKPVLISNKVNIWREIVQDNAGFVDEDTVEGTMRNLIKWLNLNDLEYKRMCDNAVNSFKNRFHINSAIKKLSETLVESFINV